MSSKMNCSKDSFDRFSDNLCEISLNYMSISDKVKLECVSKQWKSLIFNKHKILIIGETYSKVIDAIQISHVFWLRNKLSIIESLTKKFISVISLEINFEIDNQLLQIINKNCANLGKIKIMGFLEEDIFGVFDQIGQNLEFVDIYGIENSETISLLQSTPNLSAIEIYNNFNAVVEHYLLNLKNIKVNEISIEWFEKFTNSYKKQIKKIGFNDWSKDLNAVVPYLALLENLENLSFKIHKNSYYNWNQIKTLSENLKNLKQLSINAFEGLTVFNTLEVFAITLWEFEDQEMKFIEKLDLTKVHLNSCTFLKDESLQKLSLMEKLSQLRLFSKFITNSGLCHLIKNAPKLKTIEINDKHINETTIKAFIEKALSNPRIFYKFMSQKINRKTFILIDIPKNLLIET